MNTKPSINRKSNRMFANILSIVVILAMAFPVTTVAYAAAKSPFAGKWEAVDVDGSDMNLAIGGPPAGPFQITWTDDYISYCGGEAGIVRGTGWLNEGDPNLLEADVHLECFRTGDTLDFHVTFRYHPTTNTLSVRWFFGQVTIWHRPGGGQVQEPPSLGLRVDYGHDWVESFYEGGHTAWVTVTDGDGNLKATAELITEPKWYWGDDTGFQSLDGVWFDADGNQMENPPDIQPYDWVYGWVDNGASAQVQIGEISGMIDLDADSIGGTIYAPWFSDQEMQVEVECLPWGAPKPLDNVVYGMVTPDNNDPYSCSWSGEWNILPYQDVGVGYFGPDGHWVANAFHASAPQIIASESGDWFWTTGFAPGMLELAIYASATDDTPIWSDQQEADGSGFTFAGRDIHGQDLVEGNYLVVSDGVYPKSLMLLPTSVTVFDTVNEVMAGVAPAGSEVWAAAGPQEWQQRLFVEADPDTGEWMADFSAIGFDVTEEMRGWSYSSIYDDDGDVNEGSTPPPPVIFAHPAYNFVEGTQWTPGAEATVMIDDPTNGEGVDYSMTRTVDGDTWVRFGLEFDLQAGHIITMTDGHNIRTMVVSNLRVTGFNLDAHTVSGVGDPGSEAFIADNGIALPIDDEGNWSATFDELLPGSWWTIIQSYPDGNEVRETFRVPEPQISAHPAYNFIEGHEWTPGGEVEVMIDDPANGEGVDYTQTAIASENINYLYDTRVQFALAFDLKAGDKVTMTDGQYTQTMIVSSLKVTDFNLSAQTVYGVGDPGSEVLIADNGMVVPVDEEGNWSATLTGLLPGSWWTVVHVYPDRNQTVETFRAPAPDFYVTPEENEVFAAEWAPGQTLEVYVNGVLTASQTVPDDGSYYGPEVHFFLEIDVEAGDTITLTDGRWTKELVVANLQVTGFDVTSPITISGVADPGWMFIGVNGADMWIEVGEEGTWEVSSLEYDSGEWGSVIIKDSDGDQTRDIFMIPYP
jgi:hypothetical protein